MLKNRAMNAAETNALLTIALLAAFADGDNTESERTALRRMAENFGTDAGVDLMALYHEVLARRRPLAEVASVLTTAETRNLAYEMAHAICEADGTINDRERAFLDELRTTLNLQPAASATATPLPVAQNEPVPPLLAPVDMAAIEKLVMDYSVLCGALELLPHRLATMAIVPLQMRMVYRIGRNYGYALDRGHIREFLGTAGLGLAAQAVESVARDLVRGLARRVLGRMGGALAGAVAGGAFAFASTYAVGELAKRYYGSGRKMDGSVLRATYQQLLAEGRTLFGQHAGAVQARANTLTPTDVIALARTPI